MKIIEQFITWKILTTYATFVSIVFMVVEFIKEVRIVKNISHKYLSFVVSFVLLTFVNIATNNFKFIDIILYALSSVSISFGANGLCNFNKESG